MCMCFGICNGWHGHKECERMIDFLVVVFNDFLDFCNHSRSHSTLILSMKIIIIIK